MASWGPVLPGGMSIFAALTIAGMTLDLDSVRWLGIVGMGLSSVGLVVFLNDEVRKQKRGLVKNPRVWCDEAIYAPSWVAWTMRAMMLAMAIEAQIMLNKLAMPG